jgi:hypothetical protein
MHEAEVSMRFAGAFLFLVVLVGGLAAQDTNFSSGPQYLVTSSSPFLHSIATPSMSLDPAPAASTWVEEASAQETTPPPPGGPQNGSYLPSIYWGDNWVQQVRGVSPVASSNVSEIEITSPQNAPPLPESFMDGGVTRITDAQSILASGYGRTLGEVSAYWKARHHAPRVYTNADIARLHGS